MNGEPVATTIELHYVVRKRGRLYWQPTPEMKDAGFSPRPLGPDAAPAHAKAAGLYAAWLKHLEERLTGRPTAYPAGTLGAYWDRFRTTEKWRKKAPRSRDDYFRAWKHIDAWRPPPAEGALGQPETLSRTVLTRITTDVCETFYSHLERTLSPSERYRTVKCLKHLLQDAVVRLKLPFASPASNLENPQAPGRSAFLFAYEIDLLIAGAETLGFHGLSVGLRIAWDTLFSPVDVWTLRLPLLQHDAAGWFVFRARTKTTKAAYGHLSPETVLALRAYIEGLGFTLTPDAPIIRMKSGHAYRNKDTWAKDFRAVRRQVLPDDRQHLQLLDIRRSGSIEADAGGADKSTIGEILANGLGHSAFLDETYTPPTVTKAREVALQRAQGRSKLSAELERFRGHTASKGGR